MERNLFYYIVCVIFGLFIIVFPLTGVLALNLVIALPIMILSLIYLLLYFSSSKEIIPFIFAVFGLIFSILLILLPNLLSMIISAVLSIIGILFIILAIIRLLKDSSALVYIVAMLVMGIIYILFGYLFNDPMFSGVLFGLSFVLAGLLGLFANNIMGKKSY